MSEMGHFQTLSRVPAKSVDHPTSDMRRLHRHVGFVPQPEVNDLFDHLVGAGEQVSWYLYSHFLGGPEVYH
jgi:hypothetical protein